MKQGPQPNVPSSSTPPGNPELLTPATASAGSVTPAAGPVWLQQWTALKSQMQVGMQRMGTQLQEATRTWKAPDLSKGLGMKVDVDILNPTITGLKQQWQQLPEPVREVVSFAGVALMAGIGVQRLYQDQLQLAHTRYGHLRSDYEELQQHVKQVEAQLEDINMRRTGAYLEIQMTEAIAKAATAAAAAAAAAASAASACAPPQPQQHMPQQRQQQQQQLSWQPPAAPLSAPAGLSTGLDGISSSSNSNSRVWVPRADRRQPPQQQFWDWRYDQKPPAAGSGAAGADENTITLRLPGTPLVIGDAASEAVAEVGSPETGRKRGILGFKLPRFPRCSKHGATGSEA